MTLKEIKNIIVGRKIIAELLGYKNEKYINELEKEADLPKIKHNQYPVFDCFRWYVDYLKSNHEKEIDRLKSDKPQDDLARKNAELKQIELDKQNLKLLDRDELFPALLNEYGVFKTSTEGQGARLAARLKGVNSFDEIKNIIDTDNNEIFKKLANGIVSLEDKYKTKKSA
jgi:hypothetical protein